MLRDKNLIPLSHQHQQALALCVRIDRAQPIPSADLEAWQAEIEQHFAQEISVHFSAEESVIFRAARQFPVLTPLVEELIEDHGSLRESFAQAEMRLMSAGSLSEFASKLSVHIRREERQLFEQLQHLMNAAELAALGKQLADALRDAAQSCILPNAATKLRAKN
jgi:hemerythrin-like domain-containing protein